MKNLAVEFALALVTGVFAALIGSALYLLFLRRFRPNIEASSQIAFYHDEKESKSYYEIKIINRGQRSALDIRAELTLMDEEPFQDGFVQYWNDLTLVRSHLDVLPRFDRDDRHGLYAFRFRTIADLRNIWTDNKDRLRFRLIATDEMSGRVQVLAKDYVRRDSPIVNDQFLPNELMTINRPATQ